MKYVHRTLKVSFAYTTVMTKPILRGIIFDMDGTLTVPNLDFVEMYKRCGVPRSNDILQAVAMMEPPAAKKANNIIEEMEEEGRRTLQLRPGALELGQWLYKHEIPMSIVTRNTSRTVDTLTSKLWKVKDDKNSCSGFSPVISRDSHDGLPFKPHPASAEYIAKEWSISLPSKDLVMVGDSPPNDIAFGKNAGISTVLVDTERRYEDSDVTLHTNEEADFRVQNLWQLPGILWESFRINSPLGTEAPKRHYPKPEPTSAASIAACRGDIHTLEKLSDKELFAPDGPSGNTPLIWGSDAGQFEVVQMLLQRYAVSRSIAAAEPYNDPSRKHVNVRGYLGATAVCRASRKGHVDILDVLFKNGADPDIPNDKMQYPMHVAAFNNHPKALSVLLKNGANTLVLDRKGRTPAEDTNDEPIRSTILEYRTKSIGK